MHGQHMLSLPYSSSVANSCNETHAKALNDSLLHILSCIPETHASSATSHDFADRVTLAVNFVAETARALNRKTQPPIIYFTVFLIFILIIKHAKQRKR